jgi:hypothetical protein
MFLNFLQDFLHAGVVPTVLQNFHNILAFIGQVLFDTGLHVPEIAQETPAAIYFFFLFIQPEAVALAGR